MKKRTVAADAWLKDVAPSTRLRQWFGHRKERWEEFRRQYQSELDANPAAWEPIVAAERRGRVTLLYNARDVLHNGAVVLRDYLRDRRVERSGTGKRQAHRPISRTTSATKSATMWRTGSSGRERAG
jgi:uncharacterized protein YeaO (DUF488 family)